MTCPPCNNNCAQGDGCPARTQDHMTPEARELDLLVADLEVENRMMRARNTRLEAELAAALRTIVELSTPKEKPHD